MKEKIRLQSAMEYLMTYGWAILIIAVVLGALYQLGVFGNGFSGGGSSCLSSSGFLCQNPVLNSSGYLAVNFGQIGINLMTISKIGCTTNSSAPSSTQNVNLQITSGATTGIAFSCPLASNSIGAAFRGYLWIVYSTPTQSDQVLKVATVTTKVSTFGSALGAEGGGVAAQPPVFGIDGSNDNTFSSTDNTSISLTTSSKDDLIVAYISFENGTGYDVGSTVSSISDAAGLVWQRRSSMTMVANTTGNGDEIDRLEVWYAISPDALSSDNITAYLTGNMDDGAIIVFGISGADTSSPWDSNGGFPASANDINGLDGTATVNVSTNSAKTMILGFAGSDNFCAGDWVGSGVYATLLNECNSGSQYWWVAGVAYQTFSSAQSSTPVTMTNDNTTYWMMIADAVRQASATVTTTTSTSSTSTSTSSTSTTSSVISTSTSSTSTSSTSTTSTSTTSSTSSSTTSTSTTSTVTTTIAFAATCGGTLTVVAGNDICKFTSSGTFTVTAIGGNVAVLVVGGGGGGGGSGQFVYATGGGGGGGFQENDNFAVTVQAYSVVVGAGGTGGSISGGGFTGSVGGSSSFSTITSLGGGGGGGDSNGQCGSSGGSGGGGGPSCNTQGSGTVGQGNDGGAGVGHSGGGGGGAGAVGGSSASAAAGGDGLQSSITGSATYYAGGGGSGVTSGTSSGGLGGGAGGSSNGVGHAGTANTGGGGSGSFNDQGGAGGSGIVIISYNALGNGTP